MKNFKGKAIYNPSGKAQEYSSYACNFYTGCSNNCDYCYCKNGFLATTWSDTPILKKCFKDEKHAIEIFKKELSLNIDELVKNGLFFSFTTDPMLNETIGLTIKAIDICVSNNVPVKILTKNAEFVDYDRTVTCSNMLFFPMLIKEEYKKLISFGFTLTGHDELEKNASNNIDRIKSMKKLKNAGFKTFASIEPIIDFESAKEMIELSIDFCDLYKIGLQSGKKYDIVDAQTFVEWLNCLEKPKIYLKESLQKLSRYTNDELDEFFVNRDYNLTEELNKA